MGIETLLIVAAVGALASASFSAYSQLQSAKYQKQLHEYNSAVANNNAVNSEKWAQYNEDRERDKQKYLRGKMLTQYMKAGVMISEDQTPGLVLQEQVVQDEISALAIRREGQGQAAAFRSQARLDTFQGRQALSAGKRQAVGTLLTGVARATAIVASGSGGSSGGSGGAGASGGSVT